MCIRGQESLCYGQFMMLPFKQAGQLNVQADQCSPLNCGGKVRAQHDVERLTILAYSEILSSVSYKDKTMKNEDAKTPQNAMHFVGFSCKYRETLINYAHGACKSRIQIVRSIVHIRLYSI